MYEIASITTIIGINANGALPGYHKLRSPKPCFLKPTTLIPANNPRANPNLIINFLVIVN
jgi:hypothetical protein